MRFFFAILFSYSGFFLSAQSVKISTLSGLSEISGLVKIKGQYWALNDGGNKNVIYKIDTATGNILDSTSFANASNTDWEELCANDSQVFIGDFGNNNGTRKDLKIYRFSISKLSQKNVVCDTIAFYYPDQTDFSSDILSEFDCEAMLAFEDSILLFSKSKTTGRCRIYSLPNQPGNYAAKRVDTIQLDFWVTGAAYSDESYLLLSGYALDFSFNLKPALYNAGFYRHRVQKPGATTTFITLAEANQFESVVWLNANTCLGAAEASNGKSATLYQITFNTAENKFHLTHSFRISPNPVHDVVDVFTYEFTDLNLEVLDTQGKVVLKTRVGVNNQTISVASLPAGIYQFAFYRGTLFLGSERVVVR